MRLSTPEFKAREEFSKFGAQTEEEYLTKIRKMTSSDLQKHGHQFNIRTSEERHYAEKTLIGFFRKAKAVINGMERGAKSVSFTKEQLEDRNKIIERLF